jgi:hypothetical protein
MIEEAEQHSKYHELNMKEQGRWNHYISFWGDVSDMGGGSKDVYHTKNLYEMPENSIVNIKPIQGYLFLCVSNRPYFLLCPDVPENVETIRFYIKAGQQNMFFNESDFDRMDYTYKQDDEVRRHLTRIYKDYHRDETNEMLDLEIKAEMLFEDSKETITNLEDLNVGSAFDDTFSFDMGIDDFGSSDSDDDDDDFDSNESDSDLSYAGTATSEAQSLKLSKTVESSLITSRTIRKVTRQTVYQDMRKIRSVNTEGYSAWEIDLPMCVSHYSRRIKLIDKLNKHVVFLNNQTPCQFLINLIETKLNSMDSQSMKAFLYSSMRKNRTLNQQMNESVLERD